MEDERIIELFWKRDPNAVAEADKKYGKYCYKTAFNVLRSEEDARECVNDTYYKLWNAIPPARPAALKLFAARTARNLAIDRYRKEKHAPVTEKLESELSDCVPERAVESAVERAELLKSINAFIEKLPSKRRAVFLDRYWHFYTVEEISKRHALKPGNVKMILSRTGKALKKYLKGAGLL